MLFSELMVEWKLRTLILYLSIIIGCYFITIISRNKNIKIDIGGISRCPMGLSIVAILLLFIKCFNTTGRDLRTGYLYNFESATSLADYRDPTIEIGFRLLTIIIRNCTASYAVFLFIVGLVTVIPIIHFICKYRNDIDVPIAVLLYTSLYFINGLSPYRQYIAISFSLFAFDAIVERKMYKAFVWIIIASLFHIISLALLVPYILCIMRKLTKRMILVGVVILFIAVYLGRGSISAILNETERYAIYPVSQHVRFGIEQIVYYVPMFVLLFVCRKEKIDKNISRIAYIYILTGFVFSMFSYILPILGRMQTLFIPIIILIPYYIRKFKLNHNKITRIIINIVAVVYCIARFMIWIIQYYNLEDLMPYTNSLGMKI